MARYDFRIPRLYLDLPLAAGHAAELDGDQTHYLLNVLRLKPGDDLLLFNGRDGEWSGRVAGTGKRSVRADLREQIRDQPKPCDLHFLFAPLKHARLDYMVQKAVELGASRLQPVITQHTQVARVNGDRMRANAIEAAQQCGILSLPDIAAPMAFNALIGKFDTDRLLVFCDEDANVTDPVAALAAARPTGQALLPAETARAGLPIAVLIGPEGGFSADERAALLRWPNVVRLALGPRILRADTAAVAALTLVQAVLGDWSHGE